MYNYTSKIELALLIKNHEIKTLQPTGGYLVCFFFFVIVHSFKNRNKPRCVHKDYEVVDRGQFIVLNCIERLLLLGTYYTST